MNHSTMQSCSTYSPRCIESCISCLKRRHSLLNELSYSELEILNNHRYEITYKTGEVIYKEGGKPQGLICLNKGKVKITKTGVSGNAQIIALHKPVDFIGFHALMGSYNYVATAIALEEVSICIIDKTEFFKVIGNNNALAFKILRSLAKELKAADLRLINLTQKHLRARLADALLMVHEIYGSYEETDVLQLALKRADLASLANMTTANAIRVLSEFAKENLIEIDQRNIKINNLKALNDISVLGS